MEIFARLLVILFIALLAAPSAARGDVGQFFPKIYGYEGELDMDMSHERSENVTGGRGLTTSDTFFTEKLVLAATGFVYHPRFLVFLAKVGGGLSQERFTSNVAADSGAGAWNNFFLREYEFRTILLPEHPYNLELFTVRRNPFIIGRTAQGTPPIGFSKGARFTYKKKPVTLHLGYTFDTVESRRSTSDTETLNANASYYKEKFSVAAGLSRSDSRNSVGPAGQDFTIEHYSLQNQVRLFEKKFFLTSDVNQTVFEQKSATTTLNGDRFAWTEQLDLYLPWNFNALLRYNRFKDTEESVDAATAVETKFESTTDSAGFSLRHRLYESLHTAYNFNHTSSKTATGDVRDSTHSLNGTYTKRIPGGRLTAGGSLAKSLSEREGAPTVINEVQNAQILGEFTLTRTEIDGTSIRINVREPVTGAFVDLQRDTHFLVTPVGNAFAVTIISIPPEALNPDPLFVYEFRATYLFVPATVELETSDVGYSLKLELFKGFFNPYYGYSHRTQHVLSGAVPGGPEDATTKTAGVLFQRSPYSLLLEYRDNESRFDPSERYRAEAVGRQDITPTTNLFTRVHYARVNRFESAFAPRQPAETGGGGDLTMLKRFPRRNLNLSAGGSYARRRFVFDTKSYSLNAALSWSVANLDISLGANMERLETALDTGKQESTRQRYYLSMKRKLF